MSEQDPENDLPEDPEHLSLDDMLSGYEESDEDYSLEELSQAYAQILAEQDSIKLPVDDLADNLAEEDELSTDDESAEDDFDEESLEEPEPISPASFLQPLAIDTANEDLVDQETVPVTPERIVESILFVGTPTGESISSRMIASLMRGVSPAEVENYVARLNQNYESEQAAYRIEKDDLGFKMQLHRSMLPVRNQFYGQVKEAKLSQPIIDVLSVIAYHQPVERAEVERLVGRPSGANINQLIRRDLIIMERGEDRKKTLRTTARFLELFGLDEIDDLPQSEAMDDFE